MSIAITTKVFAYWCEGVVLSAVAVAGVIGNIVSALILSTKNMRNSFNLVRKGDEGEQISPL